MSTCHSFIHPFILKFIPRHLLAHRQEKKKRKTEQSLDDHQLINLRQVAGKPDSQVDRQVRIIAQHRNKEKDNSQEATKGR